MTRLKTLRGTFSIATVHFEFAIEHWPRVTPGIGGHTFPVSVWPVGISSRKSILNSDTESFRLVRCGQAKTLKKQIELATERALAEGYDPISRSKSFTFFIPTSSQEEEM
ncbi:MAG: hypothetical protein LBF50_08460 [Azoarcus sp.]|jgi:hypothetical protein|nr:hypothetical protein [Azoarcus sp.]